MEHVLLMLGCCASVSFLPVTTAAMSGPISLSSRSLLFKGAAALGVRHCPRTDCTSSCCQCSLTVDKSPLSNAAVVPVGFQHSSVTRSYCPDELCIFMQSWSAVA